MSDKGKGACRWCLGDSRLVLLGYMGMPGDHEPCPHCDNTGLDANPAPPATGEAYGGAGSDGPGPAVRA